MSATSLLSLLAECRKRLKAKGFNLWGITAIDTFDAGQCRSARLMETASTPCSAVVVGSGGRELWDRLTAAGRVAGGPRRGFDPIDAYSEETLAAEMRHFQSLGYEVCTVFPFGRSRVNFTKLAEAAGIGVISPVVPFLLHPEYGPWISLRGALILNAQVPTNGELHDFDPCSRCDSPCLRACPVSVYGAEGEVRLDRCGGHRHGGGCSSGCDVRRACPVGRDHRYGPEEESFRHGHSLPALRRRYGLGWWKVVPEKIRRSL